MRFKMVKVFEGTDNEYYLNGFLKNNLDFVKETIKEDWDFIFIVSGREGAGKSVLAQQIAYYCDPTLNIDRVTFTPDDFRKAVLGAKQYQAVIFDEAYTGLSSRSAMSQINKSLVTMMAEIRQKNLFVFIVLPSFFDLDKNIALWRSCALLYVDLFKDPNTGKPYRRGLFYFFNYDQKKVLYVQGKKYYYINKKLKSFNGNFVNYYPLNEKEYRKKKWEALSNKDTPIVGHEERYKERLMDTIKRMKDKGFKNVEIARLTDYDPKRICQILGKMS